MPAPKTIAAETAAPGRWLSIVGIGEDGVAGLGEAARALVAGADLVVGGTRHLKLAEALIRGKARSWPSPFSVDPVLAARGRKVCVLASGDPFVHGVGTTLARAVPREEMQVIPGLSAFALAAARLCWSLDEVRTLSLLTDPVESLRPWLRGRLLVLMADAAQPATVAEYLSRSGFDNARLTVLEALGGPRERVRATTAGGFELKGIGRLNLLAIEIEGGAALPLTPGLPDELFEHDGQITKREIRALTLAALAPRRGDRLWDIGAGSGSIAIEWLLADPSLQAIAIEVDPERAARIRRNALTLGVPRLQVVEGRAPMALDRLPPPDAIFIGGGGGRDTSVLDGAVTALRRGGRLVINAVTLETEALLLSCHAATGGNLVRLSVSQATPVGGMTGWRPAMPIIQWTWVKP
jgi:precorrin-6Y C5,15-methyltransferase (decarboxylating)